MSAVSEKKIALVLGLVLLTYVGSYLVLRPLGKYSRIKNPITGRVHTNYLYPVDLRSAPRRAGNAVFYPLRRIDEMLSGRIISFSHCEISEIPYQM